MWIKEIPKDIYHLPSGSHRSNFLWQNGNVYVMDNHLSATWCWLQCCDPNKKYNFMHIDRHYDMQDSFEDEDLQSLQDNYNLTYEEFLGLTRKSENFKVFSWDNYIMATYTLHSNWFQSNIFLTQKDGCRCGDWGHNPFSMQEKELQQMNDVISHYLGMENKNLSEDNYPWIVNLDLDVFYKGKRPYLPLCSDDCIRSTAKLLNENIHNIQVLTIALSPDFMNGEFLKERWQNAFRILEIMSEELDYLNSFPFPTIF